MRCYFAVGHGISDAIRAKMRFVRIIVVDALDADQIATRAISRATRVGCHHVGRTSGIALEGCQVVACSPRGVLRVHLFRPENNRAVLLHGCSLRQLHHGTRIGGTWPRPTGGGLGPDARRALGPTLEKRHHARAAQKQATRRGAGKHECVGRHCGEEHARNPYPGHLKWTWIDWTRDGPTLEAPIWLGRSTSPQRHTRRQLRWRYG